MTLAEAVSVIGLVSGIAGFVLGMLNYFRDRHKVAVRLQWDLEITGDARYDPTKKWGAITVTNIGRRSTYVSHVAIRIPKGYDHSHLLILGGIQGKKLTEGDPAEVFVVEQDGMERYAKDWRNIFAQVSDSTGREWVSKRPLAKEVPSWAKGK